jgi:hypothetical protein
LCAGFSEQEEFQPFSSRTLPGRKKMAEPVAPTRLNVDGVANHNRRQQQIQGRGGIELIFVSAITYFALPTKAQLPRQIVQQFPLIQTEQDFSAQVTPAQILGQVSSLDQPAEFLHAAIEFVAMTGGRQLKRPPRCVGTPVLLATARVTAPAVP